MNRIDAVAIGLLAATAIGAWLVGHVPEPWPAWAAAVVVALSLAKGAAVALEYMGLREAPRLWQALVLGWLALVWLAIGAALVAAHGG